MSFVTYVLLYGFSRASSITNFTPEILIQAIWRGLLLQLLESGLIKLGVNMVSTALPFLDIFAYTGYKYVMLCVNISTRVFGNELNFIITLYTASVLGVFFFKTIAGTLPNSPQRLPLCLGFAFIQFVVVLVLSWL